jgi:hypothetical protein
MCIDYHIRRLPDYQIQNMVELIRKFESEIEEKGYEDLNVYVVKFNNEIAKLRKSVSQLQTHSEELAKENNFNDNMKGWVGK